MCSGTWSKHMPNPSSFIMFEEDIASFITSVAATTSASTLDCPVRPCNPALKLTGAFEREIKYNDIDLLLSELLPEFASEKIIRLKPSCVYVCVGDIHYPGQVAKWVIVAGVWAWDGLDTIAFANWMTAYKTSRKATCPRYIYTARDSLGTLILPLAQKITLRRVRRKLLSHATCVGKIAACYVVQFPSRTWCS